MPSDNKLGNSLTIKSASEAMKNLLFPVPCGFTDKVAINPFFNKNDLTLTSILFRTCSLPNMILGFISLLIT